MRVCMCITMGGGVNDGLDEDGNGLLMKHVRLITNL